MNVRDLMTTSPITVGPETPVLDARQLMIDKRFRHVLIAEGPKLLGIVTDRDIRLNLPSPATSLSVWEINYLLARLTVESVMTKALVTVSPGWDPRDAAALLPRLHRAEGHEVVARPHEARAGKSLEEIFLALTG